MARVDSIDLNLLPIALSLYDHLNVSRAAHALGMSQPAVSMALKRLRTAFDDPLFIRTSHGISPTPRAREVVTVARPLLAGLHEGLRFEHHFDPRRSTRAFTFALSDVGEMVFLPKLLQRLRALAPGASIQSVSAPPDRIAQGMELGEIDLAIGYFPDLRGQSFYQQRLFTHQFACLVRAAHPLRRRRFTMESFLAAEHAVVRAEGRSQEIFERLLARKGVHRKVVLRTPHFLSLPMIIAQSDLVTTVPHALALHFCRLSGALAIVQPPFPVAGFDLKQHWHRRFHHDARSRWLRGQVRELFNDETDEWKAAW